MTSTFGPEFMTNSAASILETSPYPFSDKNAQNLHNVLIEVHSTSAAAILEAEKAGIDTSNINQQQAVRYLWRDILNQASINGLTHRLVEQVHSDLHERSPYQPFLKALKDGYAPPPPPVLQKKFVWWSFGICVVILALVKFFALIICNKPNPFSALLYAASAAILVATTVAAMTYIRRLFFVIQSTKLTRDFLIIISGSLAYGLTSMMFTKIDPNADPKPIQHLMGFIAGLSLCSSIFLESLIRKKTSLAHARIFGMLIPTCLFLGIQFIFNATKDKPAHIGGFQIEYFSNGIGDSFKGVNIDLIKISTVLNLTEAALIGITYFLAISIADAWVNKTDSEYLFK